MTKDRPNSPPARGYTAACDVCGDGLTSRWYDVAERFAEIHEDATGHTVEVVDEN